MRYGTKSAIATACLVFAGSLSAFGSSANAETFTMRIVHAYPEHTQHGRNMEFFREKAHEYTDGRLQVTIFPNAQLGPIGQEASMVRSGTVDATYNISGILEGVDPAEAMWNIPFLMSLAPGQGEHMRRVMLDETVNNILTRRMAERGFKRLGHIPTLTGFMIVANNVRPVETLEDMRGLRIRSPGGLMGELYLQNLGASPMTVAGAEVPVALQQGLVDGLVTTPVHYHDARWHTRYMTLPFYGGYGLTFVANLRWWEGLPDDIQEILLERVIPATQEYAYNAVIDLENAYIQEMQAEPYNVSITWLDAEEMERFSDAVHEAAIARFVDVVGADGQELVDRVIELGEGITIER